jgi:hypothetical protein
MSAGSGIVHSERNDAYLIDPARAPEPVHFIQMWIKPMRRHPPSYQQRELALGDLARGWVPIASGSHADAVVRWAAPPQPCGAACSRQARPGCCPTGSCCMSIWLEEFWMRGDRPMRLGFSSAVRATQLRLTARAEAEVLVWQLDRGQGGGR